MAIHADEDGRRPEIGAVALALHFGYEPALAILFTVPLCLASVAGGVWVSVRNRMQTRRSVLIQLTIMTVGSILAALQISLAVTVLGAILIGAALIGAVLAPLGTYYSLVLDSLAPLKKRPEVFALLRTLSTALIVVSCLMITIVIVVGVSSRSA